jgi:Mrp family chromosome partitioning ATPase
MDLVPPRYPERPYGVEIIDLADDAIEYTGGRRPRQQRRRALSAGHPEDDHALAGGTPPRRLAAPVPFHVRPAGEVRPARSLSIARRPDSLGAQQYRLLKYKLKEGSDPRVIGVSSPSPREGKTTASANLGLALAEGRKIRIMLLDLNLRSPSLTTMFGLDGSGSVASQLQRKRRDPESYWDVLELGSRLHLMGGGGPTENPAPLLNSDELTQLVSDLAEHYDYVVVDLPAVLQAADVKIVLEQLDGLLLVCRAGRTTRSNVTTTLDQLGTNRVHGLLMLDVPPRYMPK